MNENMQHRMKDAAGVEIAGNLFFIYSAKLEMCPLNLLIIHYQTKIERAR